MTDPQQLVGQLLSDPDYATGERPFPGTVTPEDAILIASKLQEAIEEGTRVRAREAAEAGMKIACAAGCSYCCEQVVMVWLPEAMRVAEHLRRPEHAAAREAFLARYPAWRDAVGEAPERLADVTASRDGRGHVRLMVAQWRKRVMCALNQDGLCTVYESRPMVCRTCHALDTNEHCKGDTSQKIAAGLKFPPLDDFVTRASIISTAMHNALGGEKGRTVALCQAVYEMLMG